jgi:hypothetical protein
LKSRGEADEVSLNLFATWRLCVIIAAGQLTISVMPSLIGSRQPGEIPRQRLPSGNVTAYFTHS